MKNDLYPQGPNFNHFSGRRCPACNQPVELGQRDTQVVEIEVGAGLKSIIHVDCLQTLNALGSYENMMASFRFNQSNAKLPDVDEHHVNG